MSIKSNKNDDPIIINNFNPKNYFNDNDLKKLNENKLQITNIGKYSITKPIHTSWIKSIIINFFKNKNINTKALTIIDSTACVGGDTISFSKYFKSVLSIEKNNTHYKILENNVKALGINNVKIKNSDFIFHIQENKLYNLYDILFIDPPWGGPNYKNIKKIDLFIENDFEESINLKDIINSFHNKFKYIILKSPTNFNLNEDDYLYKNISRNLDKDNKILLIIFEN